MGRQQQAGFTIIETVLFLALSVGLFAVLMVGIANGVTQERYKDSVQSFVRVFQRQYALATTIKNDRSDEWSCGVVLKRNSQASSLPGTTRCLIVGRFIQLRDGTHITAGNLIGYNVNEQRLAQAKGDIEALTHAMNLTTLGEADGVDTSNDVVTEIDWGSKARIIDTRGDALGDGRRFTMAIVRSPLSGEILTFAVGDTTNDWSGRVLTPEAYRQRLSACIEPSGPLNLPRTAVIVPGGATTAQGITRSTEVPRC